MNFRAEGLREGGGAESERPSLLLPLLVVVASPTPDLRPKNSRSEPKHQKEETKNEETPSSPYSDPKTSASKIMTMHSNFEHDNRVNSLFFIDWKSEATFVSTYVGQNVKNKTKKEGKSFFSACFFHRWGGGEKILLKLSKVKDGTEDASFS